MRPTEVVVTGAGVSAPIPMDINRNPFSVGFGCKKSAASTVNYTVQHTFDDIQAVGYTPAAGKWFDHPTVAAATADDDGTYAFPVRAIRLNVASSDGSVTLQIIQSGHGPNNLCQLSIWSFGPAIMQ